jgi:primosomal protein N' (replication factor Y)
MPEFCEVALPVPLDMTFTYRTIGGEASSGLPVIGGRVMVPFRAERLSGIVTALHDTPPAMAAKPIHSVIDMTPVLCEQLLHLGRWIAQYYVAPIGEVLRGMLPLAGESRQKPAYRLTALGEQRLFESAQQGASRLSKLEIEDQLLEYAVLDYLSSGEGILETVLRSATGATRDVLRGLLRKRWIARHQVTAIRDARRMQRWCVLTEEAPNQRKINENQRSILELLRAAGGRVAIEDVQNLDVPRSTLATLVRRGLIRIEDLLAEVANTARGRRSGSPLEFLLNAA